MNKQVLIALISIAFLAASMLYSNRKSREFREALLDEYRLHNARVEMGSE